MENNWYNENSSGASYSSNGGYSKKKQGVTIGQLLVSLLLVAVISGGAGAFLARYLGGGGELNAEGSAMVVEPSPQAASTPAATAEQPQQSSSDKLTLAPAAVDNDDASGGNIVQDAMSTVVGIYTATPQTQQFAQAPGNQQPQSESAENQDTAMGSGVILTEDGYIVTNNHVVEQLPSIFVYLQDGRRFEAALVGSDPYSDLAVIKIDATGLPTAKIGSSASATVGDTVYAIGNPLGLSSSVSRGIVSGLNRTIDLGGVSMSLMQTDAAVNPGNSGGGLFSASGELVGIVNAKTASVNVEGLGYAIPIDTALPVMTDLIDRGYVTGRPYLGITMQEVALRYGGNNPYDPFGFYFNSSYVTRIQVMSVEPGGAAENGGMRVNDIITAIDGKEINGSDEFTSSLYEYKVGDVVTITVLRGNEPIDLKITLSERS